MLDSRDPAIKLFGKTIPLPEDPGISPCPDSAPGEEKLPEAEASMLDPPAESDQNEPANASGLDNSNEDDHQIPNGDAKPEQDRAEPDTSDQEKVLKKPDKIIPCPRCTSMDTKFCYFNNYNVNQPRHFCKNCQRYWTAGGTMRNVPVGAGRRKSKHSAPHHRHIMMIPDGLPCTSLDAPDPTCQEAPEISLGEEKREIELGSCGETKNEPTCVSSVTASHSMEDDGNERQSTNQESHNGVGPMNHLPCYPGPPFVFPWGPIPAPWSTPPVFASPPFCSPTVAFPFMPASFWGMSTWPTGTWNVPWVGSNNHHLSPLVPARNERPILGKHTRGGGLDGEEEGEKKSLWVPKTLRIDDPDEAAKSSIWATLGIKPEKAIKKGGIFKAFQSKTETKEQTKENAHALHANPAAMCRSQTFQEST